jgi:hypothetical protein
VNAPVQCMYMHMYQAIRQQRSYHILVQRSRRSMTVAAASTYLNKMPSLDAGLMGYGAACLVAKLR